MNNTEQKSGRKKTNSEFYADTMELEKSKKRMDDFNLQKGVFENTFSGGLNNDGGVFNSSALFKTTPNE